MKVEIDTMGNIRIYPENQKEEQSIMEWKVKNTDNAELNPKIITNNIVLHTQVEDLKRYYYR